MCDASPCGGYVRPRLQDAGPHVHADRRGDGSVEGGELDGCRSEESGLLTRQRTEHADDGVHVRRDRQHGGEQPFVQRGHNDPHVGFTVQRPQGCVEDGGNCVQSTDPFIRRAPDCTSEHASMRIHSASSGSTFFATTSASVGNCVCVSMGRPANRPLPRQMVMMEHSGCLCIVRSIVASTRGDGGPRAPRLACHRLAHAQRSFRAGPSSVVRHFDHSFWLHLPDPVAVFMRRRDRALAEKGDRRVQRRSPEGMRGSPASRRGERAAGAAPCLRAASARGGWQRYRRSAVRAQAVDDERVGDDSLHAICTNTTGSGGGDSAATMLEMAARGRSRMAMGRSVHCTAASSRRWRRTVAIRASSRSARSRNVAS